MDIAGIQPVHSQTGGKTIPWKLDQVLLARVITSNPSGKLQFQIGGQTYSAQSTATVEPGSALMMKVVSLSPPGLELLQTIQNNSKTGADPAATLSAQLLQLTRQVRKNNIANLQSFIKSFSLSNLKSLPAETLTLLTTLKKKIIKAEDLSSAKKLKPALQHSGLLLESKLANHDNSAKTKPSNFDSDLKAILLRIFHSLGESTKPVKQKSTLGLPPKTDGLSLYKNSNSESAQAKEQLKYKVDDVLSKMTMNQKNTLDEFNKGSQAWFFELPVTFSSGPQSVPVTIRKDGNRENDSNDSSWQAEFSLNLETSGLINVHIDINNMSVSVSLHSANNKTAESLHKHSSTLHDSFNTCGLTLSDFNSDQILPGMK